MTDQKDPMDGEQAVRSDPSVTRLMSIPLFPLRTVLFPGGTLPLRIFEPRYVDMVRWCMREAQGFGVVLLREGSDVLDAKDPDGHEQAPQIFDVGTLAQIIDFDFFIDLMNRRITYTQFDDLGTCWGNKSTIRRTTRSR